jgi:hypothetical protein
MKIITRSVIDMGSGQVVEEVAHNYEGPIAECKGGGSSTTTQSAQQLSPQMQAMLFGGNGSSGVYGQAQQVYNQHAAQPLSPLQQQALQGMQDYFNSGAMNSAMAASNGVAQKLMGQGGVNYTPSQFQMPNLDFSAYTQKAATPSVSPAPAPAAAATPAPDPTLQAMEQWWTNMNNSRGVG